MGIRMLVAMAVMALAGWAGLVRAVDSTPQAEIGKPAPDFTLKDANGSEHSLADARGKVVVLEWMNPHCPFVRRHYAAGTMKDLATKYADKGVVWMAINTTSTTTPEENQQWSGKYGLPYPILIDQQGTVGHLYGAKTTPDMYVINREGVLVYKGGIDNDPSGTKADKINYVAQALDEVLAGKDVSKPETRSYGCSVKYAN